MQGQMMWLLFAALTLLSVNVYAHPYDEYQRIFDNWSPMFEDVRKPGKPSTILFEVSAEVERITKAESAIASIIIQQSARSGDAALQLAQERRNKTQALIRLLSDDIPEFEHVAESAYHVQDDEIASFVWPPEQMSVEHDEPVHAAVHFKATFADLKALHWFVYSIKDDESIRICLLPWGLTPRTHFDLHAVLRRELMDKLVAIGGEFADENALEIVSMQDYSDGYAIYNQYTTEWHDGRFDGVQHDFNSWESIREYFAENPENADVKAGDIRTLFRAQCKFRAVSQAMDQAYKAGVKQQAEIIRAERFKAREKRARYG